MASVCWPAPGLGFHSLVMIKPSPTDSLSSRQIELLFTPSPSLQLPHLCAFARAVSPAWRALYQTAEMKIIFPGPNSGGGVTVRTFYFNDVLQNSHYTGNGHNPEQEAEEAHGPQNSVTGTSHTQHCGARQGARTSKSGPCGFASWLGHLLISASGKLFNLFETESSPL